MDRLTRAFEALVKQFTAKLENALTTSYSVVSCDPIRQVVQVRSLDPDVSDLTELPLATPGLIMNLPPGTIVRVGYSSGQPYVSGYSSGGIDPLVPGAGSGVTNQIDAGYVVVIQNALSFLMLQPLYFPAGVAGQIAAQAALAAALGTGNVAFLVHLNAGRILATGWTVP